jgi:HSP20 family protein
MEESGMSRTPTIWGPGSLTSGGIAPFKSLQEEMNRLIESFGDGLPAWSSGNDSGWLSPRIDVSETDDAVQVTAELPGVTEDHLELSIVDDVLTIKGEKIAEEEKEVKEKNYRVVERSYGSFHRSVRLPFRADPESATASFKDGVLKVIVPKPPESEAKTARIPISKG